MFEDDLTLEILPFLPRNDCEKLQLVCHRLNLLIVDSFNTLPLYRFQTIIFHSESEVVWRRDDRQGVDFNTNFDDPQYYRKLGLLMRNAYFDEVNIGAGRINHWN